VRVEAPDHLADEDDPILEGPDGVVVNGIEGTCDAKMRDGLLCGAARVQQELAELRHGASAARLGYIRAYGEGGPHELIATLDLAGSPERAGETRGVRGERAGQFMDVQASRMRLDHYARE